MRCRHGGTNTRLYNIYRGIKERCKTVTDIHYKWYGGRGITICPEWDQDFNAFREWALANGYKDDLTIERNDVNKGYFPDNCRWATRKEQANNRTNNVTITYEGETRTIQEWSELTGFTYRVLYYRKVIKKMDDNDIFTKPMRKIERRVTI